MVCCHEKAQKGKRRKTIAHLHQRLLMRSVSHRHETPGVGGRGRSPLIRLRRLPTSGLPYERPRATRALRWGAPQAADPPTPGPEKHQKSFRRVGESFLAGIRVAHKRLQEQNPAPPPRFEGT